MSSIPAESLLADRRRTDLDRRVCARAPFVASVRSASPMDDAEELALAVDLSTTGMRLRRCDIPDEQASPLVRLEFELPDGGDTVIAAGRLLFEKRDGRYVASGVRFVHLSPADRARISRYVQLNS